MILTTSSCSSINLKKSIYPSVVRSKPAANAVHKCSKRTKCSRRNLSSVDLYFRF